MTTALHEYHTIDKSTWGAGPWQDEPDKVQWIDEATGLDCLIVRNRLGAWCGYVGVTEDHPYFGKDYNDCAVEVHGGLTFADFCTPSAVDDWERWRSNMLARRAEISRYPQGDSAEAWKEEGKYVDDYEGWVKWSEARSICHVPQSGRPDKVWWLGFDCAHSQDMVPGMRARERARGEREIEVDGYRDVYRDRAYVEAEVADLAKQLQSASVIAAS